MLLCAALAVLTLSVLAIVFLLEEDTPSRMRLNALRREWSRLRDDDQPPSKVYCQQSSLIDNANLIVTSVLRRWKTT